MAMKRFIIFLMVLFALITLTVDAQTPRLQIDKNAATVNVSSVPKVRQTRFASPFYGFASIWNTLGNLRRLFSNQKNESNNAIYKILDILRDGFTDTATRKPQTATEATTVDANATTSTTTERYRISRKEFGYILGRNYRGLNKLFHIELNEALNHSQYSIAEYKNEAGKSLSQYTIPKQIQEPEPITGKS